MKKVMRRPKNSRPRVKKPAQRRAGIIGESNALKRVERRRSNQTETTPSRSRDDIASSFADTDKKSGAPEQKVLSKISTSFLKILQSAKQWSSLWQERRVRYLAYLAAMVGVPVAIVAAASAYMSANEAKLARQEQSLFFEAANAPELSVKNLYYRGNTLLLDVENSGGSAAHNVAAHLWHLK
jgi:hypothetical protein